VAAPAAHPGTAPSVAAAGANPAQRPAAAPGGQAAPAASGDDFDRLLRDGRASATRGKLNRAEQLLEQALTLRPSSDEALIAMANTLLEKDEAGRAAQYVDRAIAIAPSNAEAYLVKGSVEQQLSHNAAARAAYEQYLKLAPHGRYASDIRHILQAL
jgi:Tfp pilus assembly protein PilF